MKYLIVCLSFVLLAACAVEPLGYQSPGYGHSYRSYDRSYDRPFGFGHYGHRGW